MQIFSNPRFLTVYSFVITVVFGVFVLLGAGHGATGKIHFDEITVERINVVEPNGKTRLVISNHARLPGIWLDGKEYPHPVRKASDMAGMIFFDADGDESGGIALGGKRGADGKVHRYGGMTFDKFSQDQVVAVGNEEHEGRLESRIVFNDRPDYSEKELLDFVDRTKSFTEEEKQKEWNAFLTSHESPGTRRIYLGRSEDQASTFEMRDAKGRNRILIKVTADGAPILQFFDASGKVIDQLPRVR